MAQDLWQLRRRKGMSVKQLAAKSGISVRDLTAYEDGKPVRTLDRHKLAKVLFVDASEIKVQSDPKPAKPKPKPKPAQAEKRPSPKPKPAKPAKKSTPPPARPGQIEHLLALANVLGEDEAALAAKIGKLVTDLTVSEARQWLGKYNRLMKERKEQRPPGTRRTHAPLPEEVDAFELNYLNARIENGETVMFKLFDGATLTGKIMGFSPFAINVRQADGTEVMIQKLALAYYMVQQEETA